MNLEKVIFGFFILLAATLNFGFVYGDIDDPMHHEAPELFAAVLVWFFAARDGMGVVAPSSMAAIVSLAAGAVFANVVSVIMLVAETLALRR